MTTMERSTGWYFKKKNGVFVEKSVCCVVLSNGVFQTKVLKKIQDFILLPPLIRCGGVHRVRSEQGYCDPFLQAEYAEGYHYAWSIPATAKMALEEKKL